MILLSACAPAHADLSAIHTQGLPQTASVMSAFDNAQQLESYTDHWVANWSYPIPKQAAAEHLGMDLGILKAAVKEHPDNEELLLLTALVAHYAYNVDAGDVYDLVLQSLTEAAKLRPSDIRPEWFRADFICQTDSPVPGANAFLALEAAHRRQDLPAAFWDNYMACTLVTNMPAHVLRAADNLAEMNAASNDLRTFYTKLARNSFVSVDPKKNYDAKEAWYSTSAASDWDFTSTACGLRLRVPSTWRVDRLELDKDICAAVFSTGPYSAPGGLLSPEIVIIVRRPVNQETLADFLHRFTQKGTFRTVQPLYCPASACLAADGFESGIYGKDGDSLPRVIAFERDQPQYPGLLFESPQAPPASPSTSGTQFSRPNQTLGRIPGKLY